MECSTAPAWIGLLAIAAIQQQGQPSDLLGCRGTLQLQPGPTLCQTQHSRGRNPLRFSAYSSSSVEGRVGHSTSSMHVPAWHGTSQDSLASTAGAASDPKQPALDDLPPDVLHRVLLQCTCRDTACLKLACHRMRHTVRAACSLWEPLVEARMQQSQHLRHLLARVKAAAGASDGASR